MMLTWLLGAAPNGVGEDENSLVAASICACISAPTTSSHWAATALAANLALAGEGVAALAGLPPTAADRVEAVLAFNGGCSEGKATCGARERRSRGSRKGNMRDKTLTQGAPEPE